MKDHYHILGIDHTADEAIIKKAYKRRALQYHPDVNKWAGAAARFIEIREAFEVLSDKERRASYDMARGSSNSQKEQPTYHRKPHRVTVDDNIPYAAGVRGTSTEPVHSRKAYTTNFSWRWFLIMAAVLGLLRCNDDDNGPVVDMSHRNNTGTHPFP